MDETTPPAMPAGWYPDGTGVTRWWDGTTWTDHVQPAETPAQSAAVVPAAPAEVARTTEAAPQRPQATPVNVPAAAAAMPVRPRHLTSAEGFWYVLQCIAFGAGYFAKVPAKKALQDFGLTEMTSAERFWYVLQCIAFGAGYFAKIPIKRALTETLPAAQV